MNFFFNLKEREDFADFCFGNKFSIIPDLEYEDNSYYVIKTLEHYHHYVNECVRFFITSERYQTRPLEMDYFMKNDKKAYYIKQRYGGPSIDFYTPIFAEKKNRIVGPGLISMYPFYYHYGEKLIPSQEIKEAYRLLTFYIQKRAKKIRIEKKIYWVGINTLERVKEGTCKLLEMNNFDWTKII